MFLSHYTVPIYGNISPLISFKEIQNIQFILYSLNKGDLVEEKAIKDIEELERYGVSYSKSGLIINYKFLSNYQLVVLFQYKNRPLVRSYRYIIYKGM